MSIICEPGRVLPAHRVTQQEFLTMLRAHYAGLEQLEWKLKLAANTTVEQRYFVSPLEHLLLHPGVASRVETYIEVGTALALAAIQAALKNANVCAREISHLIVTSCTIPGVLLPGMDVDIVNALDFPPDIRRLPVAQMGCHAGVMALSQAHQYVEAHPGENVLIVNLELCSLNEQPDDTDISSFVSRGLFGDGCLACVVRGDDAASGPRILATRQHLVQGTITHMQYQVDGLGNHFGTHREVVAGLKRGFPAIGAFLQDHGWETDDLAFLICHTGGPRVMDAVRDALGLDERLLAASRESLRMVGNLSSATVLDVLARTCERYRPRPNARGLILGFGPGSTIEMALVRWQEEG